MISCRLWKSAVAPPAALAKVLLVGDTKVAQHGQTDDDNNYDGLMWGVIGAGVAAGLILQGSNNNNNHHNDSESNLSSA